jgi:hypothetical protein
MVLHSSLFVHLSFCHSFIPVSSAPFVPLILHSCSSHSFTSLFLFLLSVQFFGFLCSFILKLPLSGSLPSPLARTAGARGQGCTENGAEYGTENGTEKRFYLKET